MPKRPVIPLIIVIAVITSAVLYFEVFRHSGESRSRIGGSGTIEATEIEIGSKIPGRIAEIPYGESSSVKKGDLIVKLEYDELIAQKYSAEANLRNAGDNLDRVSQLYNVGSVSRKDYDNAETEYKVAKAADDLVSADIENAVIYAPIDGTILEKDLETGEMAFPGSTILTMADLRTLWIKIYVSERQLGLVKLGQKAIVSVDSYPGTGFQGRVTEISSKAEFTPKTIETRDERVKLMFAVKIEVPNPDMKLKPGMPADAVILTGIK